MKKENNKITQLLVAYKQTAAKRVAEANKAIDRINAKEKKRQLLEENVKQKITDVFRPAMQQLLAHLDKTLFSIHSDKLGSHDFIQEYYRVTPRKEEDVEFYLALTLSSDSNKPHITYAYSVSDGETKEYSTHVNVEEINEQLIEQKFIKCLRGICK